MTSPDKVEKEILKLRKELEDHNYRYYVLAKPVISDEEYDALYARLKSLEEEFPDLKTPDSPTQRVGGEPLSEFPPYAHPAPMLSLDNTYNIGDLKAWESRNLRLIGGYAENDLFGGSIEYYVELKIDGVSISLLYENGGFELGATRGNGMIGELVTANLKTIKSIPMRLRSEIEGSLIVRGEVFMPRSAFDKLNKEREIAGEATMANPRNAAAGSLKLLDPRLVATRRLSFFAYEIIYRGNETGKIPSKQSDIITFLKDLGFPVNQNGTIISNLFQFEEVSRKWQEKRYTLDYDIDGLVIKINDHSLYDKLGKTSKAPRYAVAYKFAAHQAKTRLLEVVWQVGRTGIVTPSANMEEVFLAGTRVKRATLHNIDFITDLGLMIGDRIIIEKGGDIIPKVVSVITEERTGTEKSIEIPKVCPSCNTPLIRIEGEVGIWCNNWDCPAQIARSILHFCSREALKIEGIGEALAEQLVSEGLVKHVLDLYKLTIDDIESLDRMGRKSAQNIIDALSESKKASPTRLLFALGIRNVGITVARLLIDTFKSLEAISAMSEEELSKTPTIGPKIADSIVKFFANQPSLIDDLKGIGFVLIEPEDKEKKPFTGKSFLFTGELSSCTRNEAKDRIEVLGGVVKDSINKALDYVVVGEKPGSKLKKAQDLHLHIINEEDFLSLIKREEG